MLVAGGEDHIVPASLTKAIFRKYARSTAVTEYKEFPHRSHAIAAQKGWDEVAEYALSWATVQAGAKALRVA